MISISFLKLNFDQELWEASNKRGGDHIGFECLKSFLQVVGTTGWGFKVVGVVGRVMAIRQYGRGGGVLLWPLQELTSMNDERPGSVTHGAVLPVPALTRLGVVQERKVHL